MRIGIGYDIHRLVAGRKLVLGGVAVPHRAGLLAHSDGDVVLHALADALLGAVAGPDIGVLFPDTGAANRGLDSRRIVAAAMARVRRKACGVVNADITVVCEEPKLAGFAPAIRRSVARLLGVRPADIGFKAKTAEGLGAVGRGRAVAAFAAVCLDKRRRSR